MAGRKKDDIVIPFPQGDYPTRYTTWVHPKTGKRTTNSLKTIDQTEAMQIYIDLKTLMETPSLWNLDSDHELVERFHDRAVELFYGKPRRRREFRNETKISGKTIGTARAYFRDDREVTPKFIRNVKVELVEEDQRRRDEAAKDRRIIQLERELEEDQRQIREYQRKLNKHCKTTVEEAARKFEKDYPAGHSETDADQVIRIANDFRDFFGATKLIGDVAARHVNDWVAGLKRADKKSKDPLSPTTKAKYKRYISVFLTWAYKFYDLSENPMQKTLEVAGVARYAEHIIAIRRYEQLTALFDGLKPWLYWRAWVATAILAGPRWSEQAWLKVDDLYLDSNYMRVTSRASGKRVKPGKAHLSGTKTGRERNVPIERTLLLDILKDHLATLPSGCKWVFPRLVRHTAAITNDRWKSASNWHKEWKKIWQAAKSKSKPKVEDEFWSYGPDEWRHCAATAMGHSGCTEIQVAQWSGNSPDIVRRHYMAPVGAGKWPLQW